jgi:CitMHS family citrate-Mg2+:H+ or citrate-Ca2+:H+ symporter
MNDVGVFDPIVNAIMRYAGKNVVGICIATALVGVIGHIDGSSSTTILITIPFFLPIFKKLKINPCLLVLLAGAAMGVMNLLPWAGAVNRVSVVTGLDANYLWSRLIPMQAVGLIVVVAMAIIFGCREVRLGAGLNAGESLEISVEDKKLINWKYFVNLALTLGTIVILMFVKIQAYTVFMVAMALGAIINYSKQKAQTQIINKYAPAAFIITATMLASGVFVGILSGGEDASILTQMANLILDILPAEIARFLHIIMGVLSAPLGLVFGGDAYLYGVLPLCIKVGANYGITAEAMSLAMVIGKNVAMIGSPIFASTYMAIGLAEVELTDYLKFAFIPMWITSVLMVLSGLIMGIIPL